MKLGIVLPNQIPWGLNRSVMLDWARVADRAGFYGLGTIDKMNFDGWDLMPTLAAAAAVTERIRLATTILQLPARNEVEVAKQAATIDVLSEGRLDLGVAVGGRPDDYDAYGVPDRFASRGRRFPEQIARIRRIWEEARGSTDVRGAFGPAPVQESIPIFLGGGTEATVQRAVEIGDGFIFGTAGAEAMARRAPEIRQMAEAAGRRTFPIHGLAYVALGPDPRKVLEQGTRSLLRYYGRLWRPAEELIHHGPADTVLEDVRAYERSGIEVLYLWPVVLDVNQVDLLAEGVLPHYVSSVPPRRTEAPSGGEVR
ncbi:MAG TPA: LLM class flavin-dependent oxidoreductase [Actinomycetota bacterium]